MDRIGCKRLFEGVNCTLLSFWQFNCQMKMVDSRVLKLLCLFRFWLWTLGLEESKLLMLVSESLLILLAVVSHEV